MVVGNISIPVTVLRFFGIRSKIDEILTGAELRRAQKRLLKDREARYRLWRKLSVLMARGVTLPVALESAIQSTTAASAKVRPALTIWLERVRAGRTLSEVVSGWVPVREAHLIEVGERTGTVPMQLQRIIALGKQVKQISAAISGAMRYPVMVLAAVFAILGFFGVKVVPEMISGFGAIHASPHFGPAGQSLVWVSIAVRRYGLVLIPILGGIYYWIKWALPNWTGRGRTWFDRKLPLSLYRVREGTVVLLVLAALMEAGEKADLALEMMLRGASPYLQSRIEPIIFWLRRGQFLTDAMIRSGHGFPDPEITSDLAAYMGDGGLTEALTALATDWSAETVERMTELAGRISLITKILMFLIVGWLGFGVIDIIRTTIISTNSLY